MAWFKKKPDPLSDRARVLSDEIALLEAQIQKLDGQLQHKSSQPRLRSTALPYGAQTNSHAGTEAYNHSPARTPAHEPVFEAVDRDQLKTRPDAPSTPQQSNDLGVRNYDFPALLRRLRDQFRGPSTTNPKLVSYLAAGGIQGLRPLRYEKRVARNRFIVLVAVLVLILLGLVAAFVRRG